MADFTCWLWFFPPLNPSDPRANDVDLSEFKQHKEFLERASVNFKSQNELIAA